MLCSENFEQEEVESLDSLKEKVGAMLAEKLETTVALSVLSACRRGEAMLHRVL